LSFFVLLLIKKFIRWVLFKLHVKYNIVKKQVLTRIKKMKFKPVRSGNENKLFKGLVSFNRE